MLKLFFRFFIFFFSFSLFAKEVNTSTPSPSKESSFSETSLNTLLPSVDRHGIESALVYGCVNVISGHLCLQEQDLFFPSPHQPAILSRSYSSGCSDWMTLHTGWNFDQASFCHLKRKGKASLLKDFSLNNKIVYFLEGGGVTVTKGHHVKEGTVKYFLFSGEDSYLGWCLSHLKEGGKHHLKNLIYEVSDFSPFSNKQLTIRDGKGTVKKFYSVDTFEYQEKEMWSADEFLLFPIKTIDHPNGCQIEYFCKWNQDHLASYQKKTPLFSKIQYKNPLGGVYAEWSFEHLYDLKNKTLPRTIEVTGKNNRKIVYHLSPHTEKKENDFFYLTKVEAFKKESKKPYCTTRYQYEKVKGCKSKKLTKKSDAKGNFLSICYFEEETKENRGKVESLEIPDQGSPLYTFKYDTVSSKDNRFLKGSTTVIDSKKKKTVYSFKQNRLQTITEYDEKPYRETEFIFTKDDDLVPGVLTQKNLVDPRTGKTLLTQNYTYDLNGNVIQEDLTGNLTGNGKQETETKKYTYIHNKKAKNLLSQVITDQTSTTITYLPDTDLVKTIVMQADSFCRRQLYFYNQNHDLIKKIIDDGKTLDPDEKVSYRKIIEITPVNGLPETLIEKYFDPLTDQEEISTKTKFCYNDDGQKISQKIFSSENELLSSFFWDYDDAGRCILEIDPLGQEKRCKYDPNGNLIYERFEEEEKWHSYDPLNRKILTKYGNIGEEKWTYDLLRNLLSHTDLYGRETTFIYDKQNRVVQKKLSNIEESYAYNLFDQKTMELGPKGQETLFTYNLRGSPTSITYPDKTSEKRTYTINGLLETFTKTDGLKIHYSYDAFGRVIQEKWTKDNKILKTLTHRYNAFFLLETTENNVRTTSYFYNAKGELIEERIQEKQIFYTYDSLGRQIGKKIFVDKTHFIEERKTFDPLSQMVESYQVDEEGNRFEEERFVYNAQGKVLSETRLLDGEEISTNFSYDTLGRLISTTDSLSRQTTYFYDDQKNPVKTTFHLDGSKTVEIQDGLDRLTEISLYSSKGELLQKEERQYDFNHNCIKKILHVFPKNKTIVHTFCYDSLNRLIEQREAYNTSEEKTTRYKYDSEGRKTLIEKPDGETLSFFYDALGRLSHKAGKEISYQYTYDSLDRLICLENSLEKRKTIRRYDIFDHVIEEVLENDLKIQRSYDSLDRLKELILPDGSSISYYYLGPYLKKIKRFSKEGDFLYEHEFIRNLNGQVLHETLLNGQTLSHTYDSLGRPQKSTHPALTIELDGYDLNDHLLGMAVKTPFHETIHTFCYDDLGQLISEQESQNSLKYSYDSLYNRLTKNDEICRINSLHQLTDQGETEYDYDPNGNLIKIRSPTKILYLSYDTLDRLVSVESDDCKVLYTYDGFHRRVKKQGERTELFFYDDLFEIGSFCEEIKSLQVLNEQKVSVAIESQGKTLLPLHDPFSRLTLLLDDQGNPLQSFHLNAFGEGCIYSLNGALSLSESLTPWILSSKRYDPETEFTLFGFRYYSSNMGRFITPDPIGFADGPNLYAYVRNNPFLYHDPHGLFISDFFKGFASTGLQAIGFRLAVMGVGVFCPPAAVAINVAATCYSVYGLATLGVSVGSYVVNSAIDDGWQGAGSALYNIGHSFTEAGFLGGVVGSMASGKVKFNKSIRATHGGLVVETTSKTNSIFFRKSPQIKKVISEETIISTKLDLDKLSKTGQALDRGGLTKAGRALDKHGNRPGSPFPKAIGNIQSKNLQGQFHLDDILTNPSSRVVFPNASHTLIHAPDGRGALFFSDGTFRGFLNY